jgi:NTE family protein
MLIEPRTRKFINLHYQQQKASFYISQFHLLNLNTLVGLSFTSTTFDRSSIMDDSTLDSVVFVHNLQLAPFVSIEYDNLDDAYFAKRGVFANTTARYHINPNYLDNKCWDISLSAQGYITPCKGRVTIIPQMYLRYVSGASECFNMWNLYGGEIAGRHFEQQMPFIGLTSTQYAPDLAGVLRCDVRYNFYGKHYVTAMYNILGVYDEMDSPSQFYFDTQGAGLKYSYNSPIGPISLAGYWVKINGYHLPGGYFSIGYTF